MNKRLRMPVGIENFEEIRSLGFYYVDKTRLIERLLEKWGKVNLFTRPRRFGKTLNMSMLRYFFEIGTNPTLFDGLYIAQNRALCEAHLGKYPVISISLKNVDGLSFEEARSRLMGVVRDEASRHYELKTSEKNIEEHRKRFAKLVEGTGENLDDSLYFLSQMLYRHYGQKVVILIDEYDVPLDKAFQNGYYEEMVSLIRGLLGQALKTNEYLNFAVLTGCLRISKESIFTGLNNFKVYSIIDDDYDEQFGFTNDEVVQMLDCHGLAEKLPEIREWYDGYRFGNSDVYCPWDVINHVDRLCDKTDAEPRAYWMNSSGNGLVRRFVDTAGGKTREEIEQLIAGEAIEKPLHLELTYSEIDESIENLWSVLFTTGYLTQVGRNEDGAYRLVIPNREIREVFVSQIQKWFRDTVTRDRKPLQTFCAAIQSGDDAAAQKILNTLLARSISILDSRAREGKKENFYHGLLIGLLDSEPNWLVRSNVEAGDGYADIIIESEDPDAGVIIEVKYAQTAQGLEAACEAALRQIKDRHYDAYLRNEAREDIRICGIAFWKKRCRVVSEKL